MNDLDSTAIKNMSELTTGQRIRLLRKKLGWTQLQLARKMGANSETIISRLENDFYETMNYDTAKRLAEALGSTPAFILDGGDSSIAFMDEEVKKFITDQRNYLLIKKFVMEEKYKRAVKELENKKE